MVEFGVVDVDVQDAFTGGLGFVNVDVGALQQVSLAAGVVHGKPPIAQGGQPNKVFSVAPSRVRVQRVEFQAEGQTLRGVLHEPARKKRGAPPLVLLAHGLNSCRVEWYDFPERLAEAGYAVFAFDFRGHGESEGSRGIQSKARSLADLRAALEAAQRAGKTDPARVGLLGHSLGAALSVCAAPHLPLRSLVALAPIHRLRNEMTRGEFVGYNLMRVVNAPVRIFHRDGIRVPYRVDYERLYEDPEAVARARRDRFLQPTVPINNYKALVRELDAAACARTVKVPSLVVVAEKDQLVKHASSRSVYEALGGPKHWAEIPGSGHSMPGDKQSSVLLRTIVDFLAPHLQGASS